MSRLCTHPNVGGVLLISLGCESFNRVSLWPRQSRSPEGLRGDHGNSELWWHCQRPLGKGKDWIQKTVEQLKNAQQRANLSIEDLVIGTICGGSDATSGISANPAVGLTFDKLVENKIDGNF